MISTIFVLQLLFASGFTFYQQPAIKDMAECLASDDLKDWDVTGALSSCYQATGLTGDVCEDFNKVLDSDHCFVEYMNWTTTTTEGETKLSFAQFVEDSDHWMALMAEPGVSGGDIENFMDCLYQTKEELTTVATHLSIVYNVYASSDIAGCSTQVNTNRHDWYESAMARCAIKQLGTTC